MRYLADVGPAEGPALYREVPASIGILKARDDREPIGTGMCIGWNDQGIALWRLIIQEAVIPGRWLILDREFRPADLGPTEAARLGA